MRKTAWFVAALLGLSLLAGCGERKKELPVDVDPPKKDADKEPPKKDNEDKDGAKKDGTKKDGEKDKKKPETPPKHVPPAPLKPTGDVTKLTSVEYGEAYAEDSDVTSKKYAKKYLELTGRVLKIGRGDKSELFLELEGAKEAILGVKCFTRDGKVWLSALLGQTVRVQGVVPPGDLGAAILDQCDVLEVKGFVPPTVTAENLASSYDKNQENTKQQYGGKPIIIQGEVLRVEAGQDDAPVAVVLKTKPGPAAYLRFTFDSAEGRRAAGLKPGQKVKGVGTFSTDALEEKKYGPKSVGAFDVLLMEPAP